MSYPKRIATYNTIASTLASLSNQQLLKILEKSTSLRRTIGGTTALLEIDGNPIFIKKICLTDIERQLSHRMSTANLFELPLYYHYGIGSAGFGVWRELSCHVMSTNWVITGQNYHFPLMYHWRMLPRSTMSISAETTRTLDEDVQFWGGSLAIQNRLELNQNASSEIVLFLEYFPHNVHDWLAAELKKDGNTAEKACSMVEKISLQ